MATGRAWCGTEGRALGGIGVKAGPEHDSEELRAACLTRTTSVISHTGGRRRGAGAVRKPLEDGDHKMADEGLLAPTQTVELMPVQSNHAQQQPARVGAEAESGAGCIGAEVGAMMGAESHRSVRRAFLWVTGLNWTAAI
ncbi:hypothetical protein NDU88_001929 [Pleurodeles waltl]|uniref:Uncharacterized protein n=1 Tax=Pleurodeles waltl TaxID=8319 RepID=A0AAV7SE31_PLEWA|nr:hypothetical protein NDU88_001929 [Pleurodeles waltl]